MAIRITAAFVGALSLLASTALAAPAAKPAAKAAAAAKPTSAKAVAAKPAAAKPAAAKPVAAKPVAARPAVAAKSSEPPPGVRVQPSPGQTAAAPAAATPAQAAPAKAKPVKKAAAKSTKKKQVAKAKTKLKSGRAAAGATTLAYVDKNQLAVDHLAGAEAKSPLDLLASYKETAEEGDFETAGVLLRLAAQNTPDHQLITQINDVLGISMNTEDTEILLQIARASRANAFAKDAPKSATPAPSPVSNRIQLAHAAVESAPKTSRIEALGVYKRAVAEERPDLAALALGAVVQGTVDEDAVNKANILLGLSSNIPAGQIVAQAMPTH